MKKIYSKKTAAIILAGGLSSRMGQEKALLPYKNARLIDYIAHVLCSLDLNIYVSGKVDGFQSIVDDIPLLGPLGGIMSAVDFLLSQDVEAALFVPVDMPLISTSLLTPLLNDVGETDAICYKNHPLPLYLSFTPTARMCLARFKNQLPKNLSIHHFIRLLNVFHPALQEEDSGLKSTNTPEEWQMIQEL